MALDGRKVAVLAAEGYQELELWYPVLRAREENATVRIVAADPAGITSKLGYPLVPDPEDGSDPPLDAVVVAGTVAGRPGFSDTQRQILTSAYASSARIYAVGSAVAFVREALRDATGDGWAEFESADQLPALFGALHRDLGV